MFLHFRVEFTQKKACEDRGGNLELNSFSSVVYKNEGNKDGMSCCKMSFFKGIMTGSCSEYVAYLE